MILISRIAFYTALAAVTLASGCIVAPEGHHDPRRDERIDEHARAEQHAADRREEERHDEHRCDGPDRDRDDHCR